jgi:hypothetical protein
MFGAKVVAMRKNPWSGLSRPAGDADARWSFEYWPMSSVCCRWDRRAICCNCCRAVALRRYASGGCANNRAVLMFQADDGVVAFHREYVHGVYLHAGAEMPGCVTARVIAQRTKDGYASPEFGICLSQPIVRFQMPGAHERRRSLTVASCMRLC